MSDELEILENGEASFAFTGDRKMIWHGMGKQVSKDLTPEQFLQEAGLDWEVKKVKLRGESGGKPIKGCDIYALCRDRDNQVLSYVSKTWTPCQNIEAFKFFDIFVQEGHMYMDTAGSLFNGRHVFASAKLNEGFNLFGGDEVVGHLLFSNPHQFGKSIDIRVVATRTVCNNTLTLALSENAKHQVRWDHRKQLDAEEVQRMLGMASDQIQKFKETAKYLGGKKFKNEDIVDYFKRIFPLAGERGKEEISRKAKKAIEVLETQPGANFARGSFWQLANTVTYLNSNPDKPSDTKTYSNWYGTNAEVSKKAFQVAMEMAG